MSYLVDKNKFNGISGPFVAYDWDHYIGGDNKLPYRYNTFSAPEDVVAAAKQGFGENLDDFDFREVDWRCLSVTPVQIKQD